MHHFAMSIVAARSIVLCSIMSGCALNTLLHRNVIAVIGAERITKEMLLRQMERSRATAGDLMPRALLASELINEMILREALAYEAKRLGFTVSAAELRQQIGPPLTHQPESKTSTQDSKRSQQEESKGSPQESKGSPLKPNVSVLTFNPGYTDVIRGAPLDLTTKSDSILREHGYTTEEFERDCRRDLLAGKLLKKLENEVVVTEDEVENYYRESKFMIRLQYIVFGEKADAQQAAAVFERLGGDLTRVAMRFKQRLVECHGCEHLWDTFDFTRKGNVGGTNWTGDAMMFKQALDKPVGALVGPIDVGDTWALGKVLKRVDADMKGFPSARDSIKEEIRYRKLVDRKEAFQDDLLKKLKREGVLKVHEDVKSRIIADLYRDSTK